MISAAVWRAPRDFIARRTRKKKDFRKNRWRSLNTFTAIVGTVNGYGASLVGKREGQPSSTCETIVTQDLQRRRNECARLLLNHTQVFYSLCVTLPAIHLILNCRFESALAFQMCSHSCYPAGASKPIISHKARHYVCIIAWKCIITQSVALLCVKSKGMLTDIQRWWKNIHRRLVKSPMEN